MPEEIRVLTLLGVRGRLLGKNFVYVFLLLTDNNGVAPTEPPAEVDLHVQGVLLRGAVLRGPARHRHAAGVPRQVRPLHLLRQERRGDPDGEVDNF